MYSSASDHPNAVADIDAKLPPVDHRLLRRSPGLRADGPIPTLGDLDAAGLAIDRSLKTLRETSERTDPINLSTKLKNSSAPCSGFESAR